MAAKIAETPEASLKDSRWAAISPWSTAGIKVNAVSPGFTKTNLNGYEGTQTVEEGAREAVRVALLGPDGPTGTFSRTEGVIPW